MNTMFLHSASGIARCPWLTGPASSAPPPSSAAVPMAALTFSRAWPSPVKLQRKGRQAITDNTRQRWHQHRSDQGSCLHEFSTNLGATRNRRRTSCRRTNQHSAGERDARLGIEFCAQSGEDDAAGDLDLGVHRRRVMPAQKTHTWIRPRTDLRSAPNGSRQGCGHRSSPAPRPQEQAPGLTRLQPARSAPQPHRGKMLAPHTAPGATLSGSVWGISSAATKQQP